MRHFRMQRSAKMQVVLFLTVVLPPVAFTAEASVTLDTASMMTSIRQRMDSYHAGQPANGEVLRVVYFHPRDLEPQAEFPQRIERILVDIKQFYDEEMAALGFEGRVLPLETDANDSLKIHQVRGRNDSSDYDYNTGDRVKRDIQFALKGEVDFQNDFILVISGLCEKRSELDYRFFAPYYGDSGSSHRWGLCYAADCELLDPLNLTNASAQMKFAEHYGNYDMSVARFNSWYLGGLAHELGHGLSLPHNGEWPDERKAQGQALMGGGNHTYREDVYEGGQGAFMTPATGLRLAAHPLLTGSDRGRKERLHCDLEKLEFIPVEQGFQIRGRVRSQPEALAVIAYVDPDGRAGYDAKTWLAEAKDGTFAIDVPRHQKGIHELRLTVLHLNGATSEVEQIRYNADQAPDGLADTLTTTHALRRAERAYMRGSSHDAAELAAQLLESNPAPSLEAKLRHLITLTKVTPTHKLATVNTDAAQLSEVVWQEANVGWGKPARNQFYSGGQIQDGVFLELGGTFFPKGLHAHAPSSYMFELEGSWNTFEAMVGLQAGAGTAGRAIFIVKGDGKVLHTSKALRENQTAKVAADVSGVQTLELIVESAVEGNARCWSVWGAPMVRR